MCSYFVHKNCAFADSSSEPKCNNCGEVSLYVGHGDTTPVNNHDGETAGVKATNKSILVVSIVFSGKSSREANLWFQSRKEKNR